MNDFFSAIRESQVCMPTAELMLLLTVLTLCLVFRTIKTGLFAAYLFVYHWGWMFMEDTFRNSHPVYMYSYLAFGALSIILAIVVFLNPGPGD